MRVEIEATNHLLLHRQPDNLLLYGDDMRVQQFIRLFPTTIQICSTQITSKVAEDHAIDVDHREDTKSIVLEHPILFGERISEQLFHEGLNCE